MAHLIDLNPVILTSASHKYKILSLNKTSN